MPEKCLRPTLPRADEAPLEGKKPGFTLVELLISLTLFLVVMASTVGLLMSQRTLYDGQADEIIEVRIKALGYKEINTSGSVRSLEYDATVAVPLRDRGG